jgi:hypothetical protein
VQNKLIDQLAYEYIETYPERNLWLSAYTEQIDFDATSLIHKSKHPINNNAQVFLFKLNRKLIRTKTKMKPLVITAINNKLQGKYYDTGKVQTRHKYNNKLCPLCSAKETCKHIVLCPGTEHIAKNLPREILVVINRHIIHSNEGRSKQLPAISYFPSWYWTHTPLEYQIIPNTSLQYRTLNLFPPMLGAHGYIPIHLKKILKEVGVSKQYLERCIVDLSRTIGNNIHLRWLHRCKVLHQTETGNNVETS